MPQLSKDAREALANSQVVSITDIKVFLGIAPVSPETMNELNQFFNSINKPVGDCAEVALKTLVDSALGLNTAN